MFFKCSIIFIKCHKIYHIAPLEYDKGVFFIIKLKQPEQSTQKPEPEESTAVRLAKKLARQRMGEKERLEILKHYM